MNQRQSNNNLEKFQDLFSKGPIFILLFVVVAALRLYYCTQLTINTGDTLRHICWGLFVNQYDYSVITEKLTSFHQQLDFVAWSQKAYNYPIITLLFDQLIARIYPSIFFMKFALTLIEAINTALIYKLTKSKFLTFFYWASPLSIWWVSHEGQFEPLQSMFVLLALVLFAEKSRRDIAWAVLGLAIQVKLTAVFLVPYLIFKEESFKILFRRGIFFLVSFAPSLIIASVTNPLYLLLKSFGAIFNPYYYNFFNAGLFFWLPKWMIFIYQFTSYGLLITLFIYGFSNKKERIIEALPAILFLIFLKSIINGVYWYVMVLYPFILLISNTRLRNILWISCILLEFYSLLEMIFGPYGYMQPHYYDPLNIYPFTNIGQLF